MWMYHFLTNNYSADYVYDIMKLAKTNKELDDLIELLDEEYDLEAINDIAHRIDKIMNDNSVGID